MFFSWTQSPALQDWGWSIFQAIEAFARVDSGGALSGKAEGASPKNSGSRETRPRMAKPFSLSRVLAAVVAESEKQKRTSVVLRWFRNGVSLLARIQDSLNPRLVDLTLIMRGWQVDLSKCPA